MLGLHGVVSIVDTFSCLLLILKSHALQWPRKPSALSDDSLEQIAARVTTPEWQSDFNQTLDNICVERQPGTEAHAKVRQFIVTELRSLDWTVDELSFSAQTPHGRKPFTNLVATLDTLACHRLVLACHYDSKVMKNFVAATDSAVPCSQMINIVKILDPELKSHRDRKTGLTLQLIFFDGEEAFKQWSSTDSLYGSRQLAEVWHRSRFVYGSENQCQPAAGKNLISELDRIELFVLLDLIGSKNPSFYSFFADTKELFDQMTEVEQRLNGLGLMEGGRTKYFTGKGLFAAIDDDHIPFMRKDVPILHIIPHPFPRVWHKPSDNKHNLDWPTIRNLNKIFSAFLAWYMEL
ncbi:glutaminyl-peptide cyclotransferase protein-like [Tropilaelaps mercedesae]|uniref:Glutaminyl-peptide cyclotransferase n=1 Tax=Tropilaelaps mercedesae TaxID=418985 RepID=A0A1V9XIU2_9ACAR|nr:glutaminyl-peptide cyclotransferase protein-like [Tropilaelaps mercedesae]